MQLLKQPCDAIPLRRVLHGALSWIDSHITYFDPFKEGELTGFCEVPLAELAIIVLCILRRTSKARIPKSRPQELGKYLELLEATFHHPEYWHRPFRAPETLVSHIIVAAALERAGRIQPGSYQIPFERMVRASTLTAPGLAPHHLMELRHALDLAQVKHELPSYRSLYLNTLAAYDINPDSWSNSGSICNYSCYLLCDRPRRATSVRNERTER